MSASKIAGDLAFSVMVIAFANISAVSGCWAIHNLALGLDALLMIGTPMILLLIPGIVARRVASTRKKRDPAADVSGIKDRGNGLIVYGILCVFMLPFVSPAAGEWVHLRLGKAVEGISVEQATRHRDAVYLSFRDVQVLPRIVGDEKISTGRSSYDYYHTSPIVPRFAPRTAGAELGQRSADALTRISQQAALTGYQPFNVWVGAERHVKFDRLGQDGVFGGTVMHGGDYLDPIGKAIMINGLQAVKQPVVVELGASTYEGALDNVWLWALIGLGVFNLIIVGLVALSLYSRRPRPEEEAGEGGTPDSPGA
jgi:hypothetical protein